MGWSFRRSKSFGLGVLSVIFVVGFIVFAMFPSTPATASTPAAPASQVVAPVAAPVTPKHVAKQHKVKHAIHWATATTPEPDDTLVTEPVNAVLD